MRPSASAAASASWSTSPPRAVLIRKAVGFIAARKRSPDEPAGRVGQRRVQRHDVGPLRQLLERHRLGAGGTDRVVLDAGSCAIDVACRSQPRALGDGAPDRAEADDAERLAGDAADRARARARPVAGAHRAVVEVHAAGEAEQQREHVLGDLLAAEARRGRDHDRRGAWPPRRRRCRGRSRSARRSAAAARRPAARGRSSRCRRAARRRRRRGAAASPRRGRASARRARPAARAPRSRPRATASRSRSRARWARA